MKKYLILAIIWASALLHAQPAPAQLKRYEFEQIDSLQKVEKRNVIVFIHTNWCKYCQAMKHTTFNNNSSITKTLNEKFYFISLNAEEKRNISFNNQIFKYQPTGANTGTHELAEQLGTVKHQLNYPTLCILNAANEIIFQYPQFISAKQLKTILPKLY